MKKINEFEKQLIARGLELVTAKIAAEIKEAESKGRNHLFGENYIPMVVGELKAKLGIKG